MGRWAVREPKLRASDSPPPCARPFRSYSRRAALPCLRFQRRSSSITCPLRPLQSDAAGGRTPPSLILRRPALSPHRRSRTALRMEGTGEGENTEHKAETEYHCHDFEWDDLRADVEANPSFSYHISPFPTTTPSSPPPPSTEAWRSFHLRHASGKFFKERRYLLMEFPELLNNKDSAKILEVGCGNGSTVVPILRCCPNFTVYACDCSKDTLEKANEIVCNTKGIDVKDRFHTFLLDVSKETFPDWLFCRSCQNSRAKASDLLIDSSHHNIRLASLNKDQCCLHGVDFISLIFTLSAIPLNMMASTLQRCVSVLRPGGLVLFRDYGLYDMSMLRFLPHQRVGYREYMRADGTFSYFFSLDTVRDLFNAAGLIELELEYCCVRSTNRKNGKKMQRVWVHGKFQKCTS